MDDPGPAPESDTAHAPPRWAPYIAPVLVLVLARQAARPLSDPDSFWHLHLGHVILGRRTLATPDWGTADNRAWVLTQWLPEVVAAKAEDWFGLPAIMWLFGLALVGLVVLLYLCARTQAGAIASAFVTIMGIGAMSGSLSPRPHMLTYLFLVVTVTAWLRSSASLRTPWWLVPMTWVWAMCHGMWFVGPLVGTTVCAGMRLGRRISLRQAGRLLLVPLLSVAAAALTPLGPKLLLAPFAVAEVSSFITEWQPASFRSLGPALAAVMILVVAATWARSGQPVPWDRILLLAVAAGWILLAARTVALGAIVAVPLAAGAVQAWLGQVRLRPERREIGALLGAAALSLGALALAVPHTSDSATGQPQALNGELSGLPPGTVVLNGYATGGWLRWAHPGLDPVIDGMTEAYTVRELGDYGVMMAMADGWQAKVAATGAAAALLPEDSPLAGGLTDELHWTSRGSDDGYVLLERADSPLGP